MPGSREIPSSKSQIPQRHRRLGAWCLKLGVWCFHSRVWSILSGERIVVNSGPVDGTIENVREGNEPGSLQCPAGRVVRRVATRAWNGAEFVTRALQFLDEVGAQAAPAKRLTHFHVEIAIGPVVVEQDGRQPCLRLPVIHIFDLRFTIYERAKHQIPNTKHQKNPKLQIPNSAAVQSYWSLRFGAFLVFGSWCLEFSILSERQHGIHSRRASGRDGRRDQRDGAKDGGVGREYERIVGG